MGISSVKLYNLKLSTQMADAEQVSQYVDDQIVMQYDEYIEENDINGFISSRSYALDENGGLIGIPSEVVGGTSKPMPIKPGEIKYSVDAIVSSGQSIAYLYDGDMNFISAFDTCPVGSVQHVAIGREYDFSDIVDSPVLSSAKYAIFNSYKKIKSGEGAAFPFVRKFTVNGNYNDFANMYFSSDGISTVAKVLYDADGKTVKELGNNIGIGKRTNFIPLSDDACSFFFSTSVADHVRPFYLFKEQNLASAVCISAASKNRNGSTGIGNRITDQKISFKEYYSKYGARYVVFNYYPVSAAADVNVPVFSVKRNANGYIDRILEKAKEAAVKTQYEETETFMSADMINGKCLVFGGNSVPTVSAVGAMSYLFPIDPDMISYGVSSYACDPVKAVVIYDQDFNVLSAYGGGSEGVPEFVELSGETFENAIKAMPDARYVRFCCYRADQPTGGYPTVKKNMVVDSTEMICKRIERRVDEAMQRQDPLWKKTYVTFGDSFTNINLPGYVDRFGLSGTESDAYDRKWRHYKTYPVYIANRHEMNWIECGASGSRMFSPIWPEYPDSLAYLTKALFQPSRIAAISAADYLTFAYGTNDIISASPSAEIETQSGKVYYYQGTYPNYTAHVIIPANHGAMTDFIPINPNATYSISSVYTGSVSPINVFTDAVLSSRLPVFEMRPYANTKTIVSTLNFGDLYTLSGARYVMFCAYTQDSSHAISDDFKVVRNASNSIGEISSCRMNTFCGAWNNVLSAVLSVNPSIKTGIIINDSRMDQHFHDAMLSVGRYWGIPVLDLKSDPNIPLMTYGVGGTPGKYDIEMNPYALDQRRKVFNYTYNDMHPSLFAHEYRSWIIENFMKTL